MLMNGLIFNTSNLTEKNKFGIEPKNLMKMLF